ncbi:MAG TPA: putative molybdenum carrier protein [Acidimicrobiales bacterium]|nr:putative molybdenum carrier protein [Acidimicrobiales bacterium]
MSGVLIFMGETETPHEQLIAKILSGGQTGADRAAVDFAIEHGVAYGGWVPRDGWAEDLHQPPGLLERYPNFVPTQSGDVGVRTSLNVRDAHATVVFTPTSVSSRGVTQTLDIATVLKRPLLVLDPESADAERTLGEFLFARKAGTVLNVAGPRESEARGLYQVVRSLLDATVGFFVTS